MSWAAVVVWLTSGVVAGCNPVAQPAPVQVQGELRHIRQLAGKWAGEFHNEEAGRVGKIYLDLQADSDTAHGMITFDQVVTINTCTDLSRPQAASTIVMPVVLRIGALGGRPARRGWMAGAVS